MDQQTLTQLAKEAKKIEELRGRMQKFLWNGRKNTAYHFMILKYIQTDQVKLVKFGISILEGQVIFQF